MKAIYWIVVIIVIVVINNIIMLSWIETRHAALTEEAVNVPTVQLDNTQAIVSAAATGQIEPPVITQARPISDIPVQADGNDSNFIATLQRVARSQDFIDVLDQYQIDIQRRYKDIDTAHRRMSASELYEVTQNAESLFERQSALNNLSRGKLGALETYELKKLYLDDDINLWSKTKLIGKLLDEDDADGLIWAKELLADVQAQDYLGGNFLSKIYEKDKSFIVDYLDSVDVENVQSLSSFGSLFVDEPELASAFYVRNFDKILESESDYTFQYLGAQAKFEITDGQQRSLAEFFGDKSRSKRSFAINLISNISDIEVLRDGYNQLTRKQEKQSFLMRLSGDAQKPERAALIRELASASDDPDIKRFGNRVR